jgi:hypothetical protein
MNFEAIKEKALNFWNFAIDVAAGRNAFNSRPKSRIAIALGALAACAAAFLWLNGQSAELAMAQPEEGSAAWDAVLATRVAAARLWWVLQATLLTLAEAYFVFTLLDRTPLGKRLWCWSEQDTVGSNAAKTLSAGLSFVGILAALALLNSKVLP